MTDEGQTMSTDQRLAIILTNQVREISAHRQHLVREAENWDHLAMDEVLNRQATHLGNAYERLVEICEALAGGTLRIVDEAAVVRLLAVEFEVPTEAPDATRRAQLALQQLEFAMAIR
jgi:hypothetical protein